jgi:6-phosphogluconolactonase
MQIFPDQESLSLAAAALFVQLARQAVAARGRFSAALCGGRTPSRTYELLAHLPFRDQVPWDRVHVFWGDERCVPLDDPRSNFGLAHLAFLNRVPIPPAQVHPIRCQGSPEEGAHRYEHELRACFGEAPRFDLIFLGLGENGHTASLFPHTAVLKERSRWARAVFPAGQDLPRVTLTAPVINRAAVVAFLVTGASKSGVLKEVLYGPRDHDRLPAQLIRPERGELLWLADRAAGSEVKEKIG